MMHVQAGPSAVLVRDSLRGAPLDVGAVVEVVGTQLDESMDERFVGRRGLVTGLFFDDPASQLPTHPLVVVWVEGLGEELFFPGELREADDAGRPQLLA